MINFARKRPAARRRHSRIFTKHRRLTHERLETRTLMTINPTGPELLINDFSSSFQTLRENSSSVAISEAAGTIGVYSGVGSGAQEGIFLSRFDSAGSVSVRGERVSSTIQGTREAAAVASNGEGDTVVVWQGRGPGDKHGIFFQRYNATGEKLGGEVLVNETIRGEQHDPAVAMAADGSFVISWTGPGAGDALGIYARRFDVDGDPASGEVLVNTTTADDQVESAVAMNDLGDYVVVWSSRHQDGDDWGVFGQRFDSAGVAQGGQFQINSTTANSQTGPSVAMLTGGDFFAVWSSFAQDGDGWGVFGQLFDAEGNAVGEEIAVNSSTEGHQWRAQVAGAGENYLVTWQSGVPDGSGWEVMAQQFDAEGNRDGSELTVNTELTGPNSGHQQHPAVALNAAGSGAIVWSGNGSSDRTGVFGRGFLDDSPAEDNLAPDLATIASQEVVPNEELIVTVTATDPNAGDTLTYQLDPTVSPAGATIEKLTNNSARIRWTPTDTEQNSVVTFRVLVTDDGEPPLADAEQFEVTVGTGMLIVDLNGSDEEGIDTAVNFYRGGGAVSIVDDDLRVAGASNGTIVGATAQFASTLDGSSEFLEVDSLNTNITSSYNPNLRTLTLTGDASQEDYQRVLRTLRYNNTTANPVGRRFVRVMVDDGTNQSELAEAVITIGTADLVGFAQALKASGTILFGAAWCPICTQQKELFEDGGQFLEFVEVTNPDRTQNDAGRENEITAFPTWQFPDETRSTPGEVLSLQEISERSGVIIPVSDDPFLAPIEDTTLLIGAPLHIGLDGYDPNGGTLTYEVETDNAGVTAEILTGNRSARIDVAGFGDLVFELFEQRASRPTQRFIELANDDFYDGVTFHRVVNDFAIQGGDPTGTGGGGSTLGDFDDQFHVDLQHTSTGLLSFAKSRLDDTNDSQFFITEHTTPESQVSLRNLDFNHSVFGVLVEGEKNRAAISDTSVVSNGNPQFPEISKPEFTVTMEDVEIFEDVENAVLMLKADPGVTGDVTVTVTVKDAQGHSFERQFTVTVDEDMFNGRPFLGDIGPVTIDRNTTAMIPLTATDVELDDVVFSAVLPRDAGGNLIFTQPAFTFSVNPDSGLLQVTPPTDFTGTLFVEARVRREFQTDSLDFDSQVIGIEVV